MHTPQGTTSSDVLNSWKEIACYLNRGVRTVQRWEVELALPVRRPRGRRRSAVIAMRSEINQWLNNCPLAGLEENTLEECRGQQDEPGLPDQELQPVQELQPTVNVLILQARLLRADLQRSREEFRNALHSMMRSLQNVAHQRTGELLARSKVA